MCGVIPEPPLGREHYETARAAARQVGNLQIRGFLDHSRLVELLREASLLVHTSPAEGFPNVLLEAWSHGLPTVSAVDPDGVIHTHGIGEVAGTLDAFAESVAGLMADRERRREMGRRARAYVETHHAPEAVHARLATLIQPLVDRLRPAG
jgi:glycosyltransferase involved in cell wall biosynthesis